MSRELKTSRQDRKPLYDMFRLRVGISIETGSEVHDVAWLSVSSLDGADGNLFVAHAGTCMQPVK